MSERNVCLSVPFPSRETAALAYDALVIDKEPKRSGVRKELAIEEGNLVVNIYGPDFKRLRVALNSTLKNILLIGKTIDMFNS